MKKLLGLIGTTAGSAGGWWLGQHVGIMTAFFASVIGTGIGLYAAIRIARHYAV